MDPGNFGSGSAGSDDSGSSAPTFKQVLSLAWIFSAGPGGHSNHLQNLRVFFVPDAGGAPGAGGGGGGEISQNRAGADRAAGGASENNQAAGGAPVIGAPLGRAPAKGRARVAGGGDRTGSLEWLRERLLQPRRCLKCLRYPGIAFRMMLHGSRWPKRRGK